MNQRVQELIRQSVVPADQAEHYALAKGLIEPTEKLDVAKFAELIVQECAAIADQERPNYVGCGYITKTKGMLIKEHFGVEE